MSASDPAARLAAGLLYAIAASIGRLPLSWLWRLGDALGALSYRRNSRETRAARRNLELIDTPADAPTREARVRAILRATGRNALETLRIWTRPRADNLALLRAVHGLEVLEAAERSDRGVIVIAPHFGNIELVVEFMASRRTFSLVYRAPGKRVGDLFLRRARGGDNVQLVPAESNALRPLWKALAAGGTVGVTPDQQPKLGAGEFAPFFGKLAFTPSLVPKLAARSGAALVFAYAQRVDAGFELHFEAGDPHIGDSDIGVAMAALNAQVEAIARRDFRQYQWSYKRYTIRPPESGEDNPYFPDCY
ncbi:MAG TPA: lipid A biosynthesis lauroyl acyltransferase [Arenimonas sp.]|nr:lipid A biosynthesis lauroyl acyltransferase [Arenimonas sp.]